jgi:hypothetical protein
VEEIKPLHWRFASGEHRTWKNKEERVLEVKEPGEDFLNHVIVQLGVLKDKAQSTNKYKSEAEFVPNKILIKPSITFLTRRPSWTQSNTFARLSTSTKQAFKGRVAATNAWGTAVFHPLLKDYYRAAYTPRANSASGSLAAITCASSMPLHLTTSTKLKSLK